MRKLVKAVAFFVWILTGVSVVSGTSVRLQGISTLQAGATDWKRLQRLDPGARLKLTIGTAAAVERYFVQLNDSELIVLNLTAKNLPRRQLLRMAADNPGWIANTSKTTYRDNSLRIGPDGLYVRDQKVAELAEVVERIPRDRITSFAKG
jgi:hypothetical protein